MFTLDDFFCRPKQSSAFLHPSCSEGKFLGNGFKYPETIVTKDITVVIFLFQTNSTVVKLTTPESIITYHNALCLSPQNFA